MKSPRCPECDEPARRLGLAPDSDCSIVDRVIWYQCPHCLLQFAELLDRRGRDLHGLALARPSATEPRV